MPFENKATALRCRCGFIANSQSILDSHSCRYSRGDYRNPHTSSTVIDPMNKKVERKQTIKMYTRNLQEGSDESNPEFDPGFQFLEDENSDSNMEIVDLVLSPLFGFEPFPNPSGPAHWSSGEPLNMNQPHQGAAGPLHSPPCAAESPLLLANRAPKRPSSCNRDDRSDVNMVNVAGCSRPRSPTSSDEGNPRKRMRYFQEGEAPERNLSRFLKTMNMQYGKDILDGGTKDGGSTTDSLSGSDLD